MKIISLLCLFYLTHPIYGQNISSQVISSLGGEYQSSEGTITFTLGESFVGYFNENSIILSEGFHQSYNDVISAIEDLPEISAFKIYPNPTKDIVIMEFNGDLKKLKGYIFNISGQKIIEFPIDPVTKINLAGLPQAQYFISITNQLNRTESFGIIKN